MYNLNIQRVFPNNLIFLIIQPFHLVDESTFYMFRCNNKILFVANSFIGRLIDHILKQ